MDALFRWLFHRIFLVFLVCFFTGAAYASEQIRQIPEKCGARCYRDVTTHNIAVLRKEMRYILTKDLCPQKNDICAQRLSRLNELMKKTEKTLLAAVDRNDSREIFIKAQETWRLWLAAATRQHLLLFSAGQSSSSPAGIRYQLPLVKKRIEEILKYYHDHMEDLAYYNEDQEDTSP